MHARTLPIPVLRPAPAPPHTCCKRKAGRVEEAAHAHPQLHTHLRTHVRSPVHIYVCEWERAYACA